VASRGYKESHGPIDMVVVLSVPAQGRPTRDNPDYEPPGTIVYRFEFETLEDAKGFIDTSDDIDGLLNAAIMMDTPTDDIEAPFGEYEIQPRRWEAPDE
jgi:hypothetical protein